MGSVSGLWKFISSKQDYLLSITHNNQRTEHKNYVIFDKLICASIKVTKLDQNSFYKPARKQTSTTYINHKQYSSCDENFCYWMMPKLRGGHGQKSADDLAAEQRLKEEKAMSEKHKQEEEEAWTNGEEDEGRDEKRQAKKSGQIEKKREGERREPQKKLDAT